MLIYLDMCCLKRPFDDQSVPRNRLEAEAVLALLAVESEAVTFVRSDALYLENSCNPIKKRAARVEHWLRLKEVLKLSEKPLSDRIEELMRLGLGNFDALHAASAEFAKADALGTCDDRLLGLCQRHAKHLRVRVTGIMELAAEVLI